MRSRPLFLSRHFWNLYALVYEALEGLLPYKQMLDDLTRSLVSVPKGQILDAGCGAGSLCRRLLSDFPQAQVVALDSSEAMLQRARTKCGTLFTVHSDLSRGLPFDDGSFDGLVCSNVLHTLEDPRTTLSEMRRVLRDGGRLALACPAPGFSMKALVKNHLHSGPRAWWSMLPLMLPLALAALFSLVLLHQKTGRTVVLRDRDQLEELLTEAGFKELQFSDTYGGQDILVQASA